ncbi:hypothetical protein [Xenorhabdus szentirmaii]|uniref:hypothetical protein n=1 Tax=Xenorhabdus szentirmaii TaxID=290112 RepID=UPI0019A8FFB8|nr:MULTISPECIES: hypothetical protein [unclassified Xenorhabdus]MBD2782401.1 hypothetical protein [Xenorhabdus sp. 38]MBD2825612.1 hypothetical protein [Xenorhabdus sp. 5]
MTKIDSITGSQLMRLWGVSSWVDYTADYYLWQGCGVFVVIERDSHVELHMAMKKDARHRCRDAVTDVLSLIGNRVIHAPILCASKHVCNLARKFGFHLQSDNVVKLIDGRSEQLFLMVRS